MRKAYPSDLTDAQWEILQPLIPVSAVGRPRSHDMREILNAIFYISRSGCQWDMLPHDLPPKSSVYDYFKQWRDDGTWQEFVDALRPKVRQAADRDPAPEVAYIDTQTVKGAEMGGERGYDGGKKIRGVKRHLIVDSLGLLIAVAVTAASADDGTSAPEVSGRLTAGHRIRLETIWGDGEYHNHSLNAWLRESPVGYRLKVVERPAGSVGFVKLPKRWVVERSFAWLGRYRRQSRHYEWHVESSESFIKVSAIQGMLRRLSPDGSKKSNPQNYRKTSEKVTG